MYDLDIDIFHFLVGSMKTHFAQHNAKCIAKGKIRSHFAFGQFEEKEKRVYDDTIFK